MRRLNEEEVGSIALATMGGGTWSIDHFPAANADQIDLVFRDRNGGVIVRLGLFSISDEAGDMGMMSSLVVSQSIAKDLNNGRSEALRTQRFDYIKVNEGAKP